MSLNIKEIARLAGVSTTTVSMVINGKASDYRISPKTEAKVLQIVQEQGFTPNSYARGFRMAKTQTIGLVVPDLTNWFFSQLSREIEVIARHENHQVFIACSDDNEKTEAKVVQNLVGRKIDGLIVASVMKKAQIAKEMQEIDIPVVYIDRRIESEHVSWVASDNLKGAFDLTSLILSRGGRDLFYLGGTKEISTSKNRVKGFQQALETHGVAFDSNHLYQDNYTITSGYNLMKKIHADFGQVPDSFITGSFTLLEGALTFIKEKTGELKNDLLIGTYDDHPLLDFLSVNIPSVRQNTEKMAQTAFEMILAALSGEKAIHHEIIQPTLISR